MKTTPCSVTRCTLCEVGLMKIPVEHLYSHSCITSQLIDPDTDSPFRAISSSLVEKQRPRLVEEAADRPQMNSRKLKWMFYRTPDSGLAIGKRLVFQSIRSVGCYKEIGHISFVLTISKSKQAYFLPKLLGISMFLCDLGNYELPSRMAKRNLYLHSHVFCYSPRAYIHHILRLVHPKISLQRHFCLPTSTNGSKTCHKYRGISTSFYRIHKS